MQEQDQSQKPQLTTERATKTGQVRGDWQNDHEPEVEPGAKGKGDAVHGERDSKRGGVAVCVGCRRLDKEERERERERERARELWLSSVQRLVENVEKGSGHHHTPPLLLSISGSTCLGSPGSRLHPRLSDHSAHQFYAYVC
jgi:hypothetical protein